MATWAAVACQNVATSPASDAQGRSRIASSQGPDRSRPSLVRVERMTQKLSTYRSLVRDEAFRDSLLPTQLVREFSSFGAKVRTYPFSSFTTELPPVNFWINGGRVVARGLMHSLATRVRGPLKTAEVDSDGNIQAEDLSGSVVLVKRGPIRFQKMVADLAGQGAVAVVFYNHQPGLVYGTLLQPSRIPSLIISRETGQMLLSRMSVESLDAIVDVEVAPRSFQGLNLTALCDGASERRILVSTPADAVRGGIRNGCNLDGLVLMCELVRWCSEQERRHTFEFNVFDGTHSGYFGSRWHMGSVMGGMTDHIDAILAFDRPGTNKPVRIGATKTLADFLNRRVAPKFSDLIVSADFGVGRGDHDVFAAKGVPFVFAERGLGPVENVERLDQSFEVLSAVLEAVDTRVRDSSA